MLNEQGFDLWADGYDRSVGLSDEGNTYPFAGYKRVLNAIYNAVLANGCQTVLDIGFGTGTLTQKLYEHGCTVYGQDFSQRMIELAKVKMPKAELYQGDFTKGLVGTLKQKRYDAIVATYSLHHLTDAEKVVFIENLRPLLNDGGKIYIGDVAFPNRVQMEACRADAGDEWDGDEIYFVVDELQARFPQMRFEPLSYCSGVLTL